MKANCVARSQNDTATDLTRTHYSRPEVKEVILDWCFAYGPIYRALNGDAGWYRSCGGDQVRLLGPVDYDYITARYRTVYASLDFFHPDVFQQTERWIETRGGGHPENPIGTFEDCFAYSLAADIDCITGPEGENVQTDPDRKQAVEDAARFLADRFREAGVRENVHVLFSGGGIYVFLHHCLLNSYTERYSDEQRDSVYRMLTRSFKFLLADLEKDFFEAYPQHKGRVKIDKLTNQKRKFKTPLSIHKKYDLCVVPLDRDNPIIDFEKARLPLSEETLAEARDWYSEFNNMEREALLQLLRPYTEIVHDNWTEYRPAAEIPRSSEPVQVQSMPPCMRNIISSCAPGHGPHRCLAILAAYLYQAGYDEDQALALWEPLADRSGVETRIFYCWYGQMHCPSCSKIQQKGSGYPTVSLGELDYCKPSAECYRTPFYFGQLAEMAMSRLDGSDTEVKAAIRDSEFLQELGVLERKDPVSFVWAAEVIKRQAGIPKGALKQAIKAAEGNQQLKDMECEVDAKLEEWIEEHRFKTVADIERIYFYHEGVYLDTGETLLKALLEKEFPSLTSENMVRDCVGKVKRRTYVDREGFNNRNVLNVQNGLMDLETGEFMAHDPDYLSTTQLAVKYDPEADCPGIRKFLQGVLRPEDIPLMEELIGWTFWPHYNIHKAVMLTGGGRNGKGTLLRLLTALLGSRSISSVALQTLCEDRFASSELFGKMANLGGDLPSRDLSDTSIFKGLTGQDSFRAQEKFRPAFNFVNTAKLWFSANAMPRSPDDTYAFYSRWVIIVFDRTFELEKGTADPDLDSKLQRPEELSGLLNLGLAGLKRLRGNGWKLSYAKSVADVELIYKRAENPVLAFVLDECEADATCSVEKTVLQQRFNEYALRHGIRPLSSKKFVAMLKDQTEIPISDYRPYGEYGSEPRHWLGIRIKREMKQYARNTGESEIRRDRDLESYP